MGKQIYFLALLLIITSCKNENSKTLFNKIESNKSNIVFNNSLNETETFNYFNYPYMYMGGGVALGDFNNDGLIDIYFTGNKVDNQLYVNKGGFIFKNITTESNTAVSNNWCTGVTTVDINNDGLLDIYVSIAGKEKPFANKLLINQGLNNGIPVFKEEAEKYGIADSGHSTQSVFFDFDNDGDLDLYVVNYPITDFKLPSRYYSDNVEKPEHIKSSHFYKNNGNNTFTDITEQSGLLSFGLSIGVSVSDLNNDGYKDIYVSNDFASADFIYFNNGDGTFTEHAKDVTKQTSFYGMGTDVADFNNDGLFDIMQLDMSPSTHKRSKENMAGMDPINFQKNIDLGLHHQYMYNTLQLNRGLNTSNLPIFSNIAAFSSVKSTDWSWGVLFADFNNNGNKDIFVSNGIRRDINNNDFFKKITPTGYFAKKKTPAELFTYLTEMPSEPLENYLFMNDGKLKFKNKSTELGLDDKTFSNGASYADLDNDGDLDLIVNNLDSEVLLYENKSETKESSNYLKINFKGNKQNQLGIGNTVTIYKDGKLQIAELMLTRGYQSSVAPELHFGIKDAVTIDSLLVQWTNGSQQKLTNVKTNQLLTLDYKEAEKNTLKNTNRKEQLFTDITKDVGINFIHKENDYFDYGKEPLLPHKMSQFGPGLAVGDVNGDELEDFWIGGAYRQSGSMYIQKKDGTFQETNIDLFLNDKDQEDLDGVFFDVDSDGDLDLYVVSGGNEFAPNSKEYKDRLYINNGKGVFTKNNTVLPEFLESGSKVLPFDYDKDGDMDLFIGSRLLPQFYPTPPNSHLLENVSTDGNIKFVEAEKNKQVFEKLGLVTDAISIDFDNDNDQDLIVVGEWMPITFLENENEIFTNTTKNQTLKNTTGWWYSIHKSDMDGDGDKDFIVGNLGLNYKYKAKPNKTFDVFANDFDNNKSLDVVLGYYEGKRQLPVRGRECSSQQIPGIKQKFTNYENFADADLVDIYTTKKLNTGIHYKAETFASVYIENLGNNTFKSKKLPKEAQFSSINAILTRDYNKDGNKDILVAGNLYQSEVETPRNDASIGLLMKQTKKSLQTMSLQESGFLADNDVKKMQEIIINGQQCILIANNNSKLQVFKVSK